MRSQLILVLLGILPTFAFAVECEDLAPIKAPNIQCVFSDSDADNFGDKIRRNIKYCNSCKVTLLEGSPSAIDKKSNSDYGFAVLDEFQKELSTLTLEIVKSKGQLKDVNVDSAVSSCSIEKNLEKPKCLTGILSEGYLERISQIKNSLASELAGIISGVPTKDGLYKRDDELSNMCVSENEALYAQMRYSEQSLTPQVIEQISRLVDLGKFKSLDQYYDSEGDSYYHADGTLMVDKDKNRIPSNIDVIALKRNPVITSILNDPKKLNEFLNKLKKHPKEKLIAANIKPKKILEEIYSQESSINYAIEIKERCENLFRKTSSYLNEIFCVGKPKYVATDLESMEIISAKRYRKTPLNELKNEATQHCNQILLHEQDLTNFKNKTSSNAAPFKEIRDNITLKIDPMLRGLPLNIFKIDAYNNTIGAAINGICNTGCSESKSSWQCSMKNFVDEMRKSGISKELAKDSGDKMNLVLRSLIGKGTPQRNNTQDLSAMTTLKNAGILSGGDAKEKSNGKEIKEFQAASVLGDKKVIDRVSSKYKDFSIAPVTPVATDDFKSSKAGEVSRIQQSYESDSASRMRSAQTAATPVESTTSSAPATRNTIADEVLQDIKNQNFAAKPKKVDLPQTVTKIGATESPTNTKVNDSALKADATQTVPQQKEQNSIAYFAPAQEETKAKLNPENENTFAKSSLNKALNQANALRESSAASSSAGRKIASTTDLSNPQSALIVETHQVEKGLLKALGDAQILISNSSTEIKPIKDLVVSKEANRFVVKIEGKEMIVVMENGKFVAVPLDPNLAQYKVAVERYFNDYEVTLKVEDKKLLQQLNKLKPDAKPAQDQAQNATTL